MSLALSRGNMQEWGSSLFACFNIIEKYSNSLYIIRNCQIVAAKKHHFVNWEWIKCHANGIL